MATRFLTVHKHADDVALGTKVLRISIGGVPLDATSEAVIPGHTYITYRGDLKEVQELLREVVRLFDSLEEEPPIEE